MQNNAHSAGGWLRALDAALGLLLATALLVELAVVFCNVIGRAFFGLPLLWSDEAAKLALSTIAFLGGAFAYRRGEHAFVHTLLDALPAPAQRVCYALNELLVLTLALIAGYNAVPLFIARWDEATPSCRCTQAGSPRRSPRARSCLW